MLLETYRLKKWRLPIKKKHNSNILKIGALVHKSYKRWIENRGRRNGNTYILTFSALLIFIIVIN